MPGDTDAKGLKRPASPMRGHDPTARKMRAVRTDHEILITAMRDISIVKKALSSKAPKEMLRTAPNLIMAYRYFMHKGRVEHGKQRHWEYRPASKEFKEGLHRFSRMVNEMSNLDLNSDTAKTICIGQLTDANIAKRCGCIKEPMQGVQTVSFESLQQTSATS